MKSRDQLYTLYTPTKVAMIKQTCLYLKASLTEKFNSNNSTEAGLNKRQGWCDKHNDSNHVPLHSTWAEMKAINMIGWYHVDPPGIWLMMENLALLVTFLVEEAGYVDGDDWAHG